MAEFQICLNDNELSDLTSKGIFYTWSNERPDDPVFRKLDRAVVNEDWATAFPETRKSFKYFSFLSIHPKFKEAMLEAWSKDVCVGSKLFILGLRMKEVKLACKSLNMTGFGNIQQKTKESLERLELVQSSLLTNPSPSLFREEFIARQKWNFFVSALEIFYRRKSRIRWTNEGDDNTAFFHWAVIANQARNCIKFLRGPDGLRIENQDQIKDMAIAYFQNVLGSESVGVSPLSVQEIKDLVGFRCSQNLAAQLVDIPSDVEIRDTLFRMPRNKAFISARNKTLFSGCLDTLFALPVNGVVGFVV
ncbi:unnamed protein product [Arabidopsis halleri]